MSLSGAVERPGHSRHKTKGPGARNCVASRSPSGCRELVLGSCQTPSVATQENKTSPLGEEMHSFQVGGQSS